MRKIGIMLAVLGCLGVMTGESSGKVQFSPVPEGEAKSTLWKVTSDGNVVDLYTARTCDPPFDKNYDFGGEYAFLSFDMEEPVSLKLDACGGISVENVRIQPENAPVKIVKKEGNSLEIVVEKPCQFSVEPNGRKHPLLIFANAPESAKPNPQDPNVIWIPQGVTAPESGKITLTDNQTLYLEAGAVLRGGLEVRGKNIRITGRGILDGNPWEWRMGPTPHVIDLLGCENVQIDGIIVRGASHWTIVPKNCDQILIENVKICGGRVQNDDGINPCNSRHVTIRNCFIRSDDDCIAIKGLRREWGNCEDILVENCIFWCDRARITLLGHESRADFMRRITFRNCDVIHFQMPIFLLEPGEEMRLEEIRVENIRIHGENQKPENWIAIVRPTVNQYMRTQSPGHIRDCLFQNITLTGVPGWYGILLEGKDEQHQTENIRLENIQILGKPLHETLRKGSFLK
ncbi:MAG: glycosyl hydrolase family 28 protein [Planctomycetia bacterium]|nr:glycosyl hydrolase family 28 protein [Planctomycetia bacterium]